MMPPWDWVLYCLGTLALMVGVRIITGGFRHD